MRVHAMYYDLVESARYQFGDGHPFDPIRLSLTRTLLQSMDALSYQQIITAQTKSEQKEHIKWLEHVHRGDYIETVKLLSKATVEANDRNKAALFGFDYDDTPYFHGMHEAALSIVGGTVGAAQAIMTGSTLHAYHPAGGLHHAFPERAAGFCVYNDAAAAIAYIKEIYSARVLYIDTDVHHGDGVQWVFYDDPGVCTYSIHETGKFLYPGTGYVYERGIDLGYGTSFNLPVEPYTEDDSWLSTFEESIRSVARFYKPDIIVSQHGCDAHAYDPLSHIHCTMRIYAQMPAIIHDLAHQYSGGKWLALGGGGYDLWRVVPRAWSLVWLVMNEHKLAGKLIRGEDVRLPEQWGNQWQSKAPVTLPSWWLQDPEKIPPIPRRSEIEARNKETLSIALQGIG